MNHTAAEVLRASIVAAGIGVLRSKKPREPWPVYVGHMPDDKGGPDNAICVYDTAPIKDGRLQRGGKTIKHPGWQVRIRATDYQMAQGKMAQVEAHFDGIRCEGVAIDDDSYIIATVTQTSGPLAIGQEPDGKRRDNFTLNGTTTVRST